MDVITDIFMDAVNDSVVVVPFLFLTYVVLETIEHASQDRLAGLVRKAGPVGPVVGAVLGVVPQCGFSAMGATLYAGRVITLGTLFAVLLSTSDEMLPLLVAEQVPASQLAGILATKAIVGLVVGCAVDLALRVARSHGPAYDKARDLVHGLGQGLVAELAEAGESSSHIHELCEREHCGCDEDIAYDAHRAGHHGHEHAALSGRKLVRAVLRSAVVHTAQVTGFIFLVTLVLAIVLHTVGEQALAQVLSANPAVATLLAALIGLIPNCAASVVTTQLYLEGALAYGPMMAASLTAAGTGLLVLFRTNQRPRENMLILAGLYLVAVVMGFVL